MTKASDFRSILLTLLITIFDQFYFPDRKLLTAVYKWRRPDCQGAGSLSFLDTCLHEVLCSCNVLQRTRRWSSSWKRWVFGGRPFVGGWKNAARRWPRPRPGGASSPSDSRHLLPGWLTLRKCSTTLRNAGRATASIHSTRMSPTCTMSSNKSNAWRSAMKFIIHRHQFITVGFDNSAYFRGVRGGYAESYNIFLSIHTL